MLVWSCLAWSVCCQVWLPSRRQPPADRDDSTNIYLALGDSVPFGFDPLLVQPGVDPDVFVGYPELASDLFRPGRSCRMPAARARPVPV